MGNPWKPRFHELEHNSKMWLLKTHSCTSERQCYIRRRQATPRKRKKKRRPTRKGREIIRQRKSSPCHQQGGVGGGGWGEHVPTETRKVEHKNSCSPVPQYEQPIYPDRPRPRAGGSRQDEKEKNMNNRLSWATNKWPDYPNQTRH